MQLISKSLSLTATCQGRHSRYRKPHGRNSSHTSHTKPHQKSNFNDVGNANHALRARCLALTMAMTMETMMTVRRRRMPPRRSGPRTLPPQIAIMRVYLELFKPSNHFMVADPIDDEKGIGKRWGASLKIMLQILLSFSCNSHCICCNDLSQTTLFSLHMLYWYYDAWFLDLLQK